MNFGAVIKKLKSMKKARQVEDWVEQEDKGAVEVKLTKYLAYAEHPDSPGKLKALWSRARSTYM